jgi:hypothetical protein
MSLPTDCEIIAAALKAGSARSIKRDAHLYSEAYMALARIQGAAAKPAPPQDGAMQGIGQAPRLPAPQHPLRLPQMR